ncbi:M23 family metallopeptidase [Melittangium boletus]|uniref:M23 family metallopeptidase n=1 Tax=Melittangium boletus TaxID=83453 RepID=UPI003DA30A7B
MRGWSLAIVMGLAVAGCGPEAEKQEQARAPETEEGVAFTQDETLAVGEDAQDPDGTVQALAAQCQMPLKQPPTRVWDPPNHYGVDFPAPGGEKVGAVAAGKVVLVDESNCLGRYVVVKHAHDGKFSGYSHLSARSVKVGDSVKKGQQIGKVGSTGTCSTGNHLHLTMSTTSTGFMTGNTMDPLRYIRACD